MDKIQPFTLLGGPVSQTWYYIWDKTVHEQNVGRLSFIYAGEGQADDEGIPEKGIFCADMLILEVFSNLV